MVIEVLRQKIATTNTIKRSFEIIPFKEKMYTRLKDMLGNYL